jgi:hypothetical protein
MHWTVHRKILKSVHFEHENLTNLLFVKEQRSVFWEVMVSVKILHIYMCPIPNSFRDRAISLRTVSNTGINCSSDKVGTVYPV